MKMCGTNVQNVFFLQASPKFANRPSNIVFDVCSHGVV